MADEHEVVEHGEGEHDEEDVVDAKYTAPAQKSLGDILAQDAEDASLQKYKQALLGSAVTEGVVVDSSNPLSVLVRRLVLVVPDREDVVLDLTQNLDSLKQRVVTIKEGIQYRLRIDFHVQREIVTGLKYLQKTYRKGIQVDKMCQMMGSYGPRAEPHSFLTSVEDAPSGMLARGAYTVKSVFCDDDKHEYLKWEWSFEIKKDW